MDNTTIAKMFGRMADMLEILGENRFRVQAYRRAAQTVEATTHELATLSKERLMDIPGIGNDLADKIVEIGKTGKCKACEDIKKKVPEGLLEILAVEGMGPKTTALVWKKFGVNTLTDVEKLLGSGKLEKIPGFGEKKVANIKRGIEIYKKLDTRHPLDDQGGELVRLPHGLQGVEEKDIRGDLHLHSQWSDGQETIETMAREAKRRGYDYIAITDHASAMGMVRGVKSRNIADYIAEIREVEKKVGGMRVLAGVEVDIEKDGSLYLPDTLLKKFNFVVAAIHSNMKQDRATVTKRVIRAMENPYVHCIGHLTTRLIGKRAPMDFDMEAILRSAKRMGTIMELNAQFLRLDLSDAHCRLAKQYGVRVAISTDAHTIAEFNMMGYGIAMAQRGWLEKKDVVNTRTWKAFRKLLEK